MPRAAASLPLAAGCLLGAALLVGGGGCTVPSEPIGSSAAPLTESSSTRSFPAAGVFDVGRGRCTGTLVGRTTVLTSHQCLNGARASSLEFTLSGDGETYQVEDMRSLRDADDEESVRATFDSSSATLSLHPNDVAIVRLAETPPLRITRASLTTTPARDLRGPFALLGSDSSDRVVMTEHSSIEESTDGFLFFGDERGGVVENGDIGGGTFARVGSAGGVALVGLHSERLERSRDVPNDMTADIRLGNVLGAIEALNSSDLCINGQHRQSEVDCSEVGRSTSSSDEECGDGRVEGGERCDDDNTRGGDGCSSRCEIESGWRCTTVGGRSRCIRRTSSSGDGECGNGDRDPGEECDDGNERDRDGCSDRCRIERGWTCRDEPSFCSRDDGPASCGNGELEGSEECDDRNRRDGDGCDSSCREEDGWVCRFEPSRCTDNELIECGDQEVDGFEECDDGNETSGDGCDSSCDQETGWVCRGAPSDCDEIFTVCGDGLVDSGEECDDGGRQPGDGCDGVCREEPGYECSGDPSICRPSDTAFWCGDGVVESFEECDDGDDRSGDGCSSSCRVEIGFTCSPGQPSECREERRDFTNPDPVGSSSTSGCTVSSGPGAATDATLSLLVLLGWLAPLLRRRRSRARGESSPRRRQPLER